MSEYKPKILLYGNCQFSVIANWLNKFDCLELLQPESYGLNISYNWEKSTFFPPSILKNTALLEALNDADYFIFHDVVNPKFFASKDLYDQSDSKKICITNFCLTVPAELNEESISNSVKADVNELVRRVSIIESKYGSDYIDMSKWIEGNWRNQLLWGNKDLHPTMFYYIELFKQIKNKLFLDLDIDPTKNIPKRSHPLLSASKTVEIQNILPDIEMPNN